MSDHPREPDHPTRPIGPRQRLGDRIGPYELVELLGEGGMGQVFLARQREPIRREVALKLIKWGMDTEQVVARFGLERQSLAIMEHPNIAKVLDAGATDDGRPYFVMEFVPGVPLTEYCDRHRLSTDARLGLIIDVCEAVQHAHQKGIIHRDLKPTNVLVELIDDRPAAKIIDFGVAKATARQMMEQTLFTEHGQLVGTPEYMSPEQAEHGDQRIDTRTDIYSLGVLLYELLVGVLPFDPKSLRSRGLAEIHRILREEEPPKPSTRFSTQGAASEETAGRRGTSSRILLNQLRGDLDQIVMKAMDKDRTRRYASASEFAADLRRFQRQEPVQATPPSVGYRTRKFVRRNRALVAAAGAVAAALLLGAAVSSWQAVRATRAEAVARNQSALATRTRDYLLTVFDQANPSLNPLGRETTIQEALDRAVLELSAGFAGEPALEAAIRQTLGEAYDAMGAHRTAEALARDAVRSLEAAGMAWQSAGFAARLTLGTALNHQGSNAQAESMLRAALARPEFAGLDPELRAGLLAGLAEVRQEFGAYAEADSLYLAAIALLDGQPAATNRLRTVRQWHAGHLRRMGREAEAEALVRELLAELAPGDGSLYRRSFLRGELATLLALQGRPAEALALAVAVLGEQVRVLGDDHRVVGQAFNRVAVRQLEAHELDAAHASAERSLAVLTTSVGADHASAFAARNTLANILSAQGDSEAALAAHRQLLADRLRVQGGGHPDVILARTNLATVLKSRGHLAEAEEATATAVADGLRELGPGHRYVIAARNSAARLAEERGRRGEARAAYESILADAEADPDLGRHHPEVLLVLNNLGYLLGQMGEHKSGILLLEEFLRVHAARFPAGHGAQQTAWNNLGTIRQAQQDLDGAAAAYEHSLAMGERVLGADNPTLTPVRNNLATVERERGRYAEAERLFAQVIVDFKAAHGENHVNVCVGMHNHAYTLIFLDRLPEAEAELRAALAAILGILPETHLISLIARSSLGFCLARQGRFDAGEADLLWAYRQMTLQLDESHPRARKIAGYLAETYAAWGRPDEAAAWHQRAQSP